MFKAIRDSAFGFGHRLGTAWRDLRAKGTVRLFVFELAVVVIGVLIAQGLASWVRARDATAQMEATVAQVRSDVGQAHHTGLIWQAALPCLRDRVDGIMRLAAEGDAAENPYIARPVFQVIGVQPIPEQDLALMTRVMDQEEVTYLDDVILRSQKIDEIILEMAGDWEQFARLDPALGPVSTGDRDAVRQAGGKIRSRLRSLEINLSTLVGASERLGIPAQTNFRLDDVHRPVRNCSEIWHWGDISVPLNGHPVGRDMATTKGPETD